MNGSGFLFGLRAARLLVLLSVAVSTSAPASLITQTHNLSFPFSGSASTNSVTLPISISGQFTDPDTFALFDPALGTLTEVAFVLDGGLMYTGDFSGTTGGAPEVSITGSSAVSGKVTGPSFSATFTPTPLVFTISSSSDFSNISASLTQPTFAGVTFSGGGFSSFTGVGTLDIPVEFDVGLSLRLLSGASATEAFTADWPSSVTLTYRYNPAAAVPEPATLALVGIGLVGMGAWRRRGAGNTNTTRGALSS